MKSKQKICFLVLSFCMIFFSSCTSENSSNQNLVLKGTFSDEVVTLDPYFLARQKQALHSFFGFSSSESSTNNSESTSDIDDDELEVPETRHSMSFNKNEYQNNSYGGIEIIWPTSGTLTSLFGMRSLARKTRMHTGIDIGAAKGTPITSAADGQVLFAGVKRGYGYAVILGHDNAHETLYGHMSKISVRVGQFVTRNKLIGLVGKTGRVTGANLHFETRINGIAYNPLEFLPPNHSGKVRVGMKTPSYAEQLDYYGVNNKVAYRGR
ncbi:MAG: M23 family metallopeptidase [Bdellovibrionota bacterium]